MISITCHSIPHKVNTSRFDVGGKTLNVTGLDAFIYPERDIYRPGEQINYSVILRDYTWKSPGRNSDQAEISFPQWKGIKIVSQNPERTGIHGRQHRSSGFGHYRNLFTWKFIHQLIFCCRPSHFMWKNLFRTESK